MSNFIYYEKLEDYEEQVRKAKECDKKDKEIERLNNNWQQAIEDLSSIANELELEEGNTIYDILDKIKELKGSDKE